MRRHSGRRGRKVGIAGLAANDDSLAGRSYARVYRTSGKRDVHEFLAEAVEASGGTLLAISEHTRAPIYLGIGRPDGVRIGAFVYLFRCNGPVIRGRDPDEHRVQIRYGAERTWHTEDHPLAFDPGAVDTTLVLGAHPEANLFIGLDPASYDPLPMGISIEFRDEHVSQAQEAGWFAWERENRSGRRREASRGVTGLETIIAFTPERLLDYVEFEQSASDVGLDQPLRLSYAEKAAEGSLAGHRRLEEQFDLTSEEILQMISERHRLTVAVRGGVAELHLKKYLEAHPDVEWFREIDEDGQPDFEVRLSTGVRALIECKNVSPRTYADGTPKVEVQKTRSQKNDPAGRFYRPDQFDIVAACLFSVTGVWEFRFRRTADMDRHESWPDRLAVMHGVDSFWAEDLAGF